MSIVSGCSKEFRYLQRKFEIPQVMDAALWRFLRLRPGNFPHVRLAQLASLVLQRTLLSFFRGSWRRRAAGRCCQHTVCRSRFCLLGRIIIMFGRSFPAEREIVWERGAQELDCDQYRRSFLCMHMACIEADERLCERAGLHFLEELKAENNHVIRSWGDAGLPVGYGGR